MASISGNGVLKCDRLNIRAPGRRVLYTCVSVSTQYIALGTNVGTIYVYNLATLSLVKTLDGAGRSSVVRIGFSPSDHNIIALAYDNGSVVVIDGRLETMGDKSRVICKCDHHHGSVVTCLSWSEDGDMAAVGDDRGCVTMISYTKPVSRGALSAVSSVSGMLSSGKGMTAKKMAQMDSTIVQMEMDHSLIVISTLTRCMVGTVRQFRDGEQLQQVGRNLRRGVFGACFDPNSNGRLLACRPGKRIWLADSGSGGVLSTLKLKLPDDVWTFRPFATITTNTTMTDTVKQACNFCTLLPFKDMVITHTRTLSLKDQRHHGYLMFIDTKNCCVLSCFSEFGAVVDVCIGGNGDLFVLHRVGKTLAVSCVTICTIDTYILHLLHTDTLIACGRAVVEHANSLSHDTLMKVEHAFAAYTEEKSVDFGEIHTRIMKLSELSRSKPRRTLSQPLMGNEPVTFRAIDTAIPFPITESDTQSTRLLNSTLTRDKRRNIADILSPHGTSQRSLTTGNGSNGSGGDGQQHVKKHKTKRSKRSRQRTRASVVVGDDDVNILAVCRSIIVDVIHTAVDIARDTNDDDDDDGGGGGSDDGGKKSDGDVDDGDDGDDTAVIQTERVLSASEVVVHPVLRARTAYETLIKTYKRLCVLMRESGGHNAHYQAHTILHSWFVDMMIYIRDGSDDHDDDDDGVSAMMTCAPPQWRSGSSLFQRLHHPYTRQLGGGGGDDDDDKERQTHSQLSQCLLWLFECMALQCTGDVIVLETPVWPRARMLDYVDTYADVIGVAKLVNVCSTRRYDWIITHITDQHHHYNHEYDSNVSEAFNRGVDDVIAMIKRAPDAFVACKYAQQLLHECDDDDKMMTDVFSLFIDIYPCIQPWYVRMIYDSTTPTDRLRQAYTMYLYELIHQYHECATDMTLIHEWIELALIDQPDESCVFRQRQPQDVLQSCSQWPWSPNTDDVPIIDSHMLSWRHDERIITMLQHHVYDDEYVCALFAKHGYAKGLQILYTRHNDAMKSSIELGVMTNDIHSVEATLRRHHHDHNAWTHLIEAAKHMCTSITPYMELMVRVLGVKRSLKTLEHILINGSDADADDDVVNIELVNMMLLHANGDAVRAKLRHDMLETTDAHLWTHTMASSAMTEPLRTLLSTEEELNSGVHTLDDTGELKATLNRLRTAFMHVADRHTWKRGYEDSAMSGHWGRRVSLAECVCGNCMRRIRTDDELRECIVFQCGHVYHSVCVHHECCDQCYTLTSLLEL